ncbi:Alkaline phosphatase synthesis transcriptional regulatory protein PhoP [Phycisphaerae bacterium RAS1]|nr:Alkaline phosphatase synthesis transcriptional regulatory protein PhoP [Phycisphaerae bacterium RAS1]
MKRILICDDERHVIEGLRFLLRGPERVIVTAADGVEGQQRFTDQTPDLLITDVMMPRMSGLELVAWVRRQPRLTGLPIVILTAKGQAQDAEAAQNMWGAVVMAKPFDPNQLRERVAAMLEGAPCAAAKSR